MQNLFDDIDDPLKADDDATPQDRLAALATVIVQADCDILAVQEIENLDLLEDFNDIYLDDLYTDVVLVEGNDPRGIDVAVLSKFDLTGTASYRDRKFSEDFTDSEITFSRDLLAVHFTDSRGTRWTLLTTHLKSGRGGHNSIRRHSQAEEIRKIIREDDYVNYAGRGYCILAGDLNAEPWSDDLDPLAHVPFTDPGRDLSSRATHASGMTLDYILLSPDADSRYVVGSYSIFRDDPARKASDHYLVFLDIAE